MTIEPVFAYILLVGILYIVYKIGYLRAQVDSRVDAQKQIDWLEAKNVLEMKNLTNKYKLIVNQLLEASQKHQEAQMEQEDIDDIPLYKPKKEDLN